MSVDLHHTVTGPQDAPTLLLVGSLGSTHTMWRPQAEALSAVFRLVCLDLRGHGASPVPEGPYTMADLGGDVLALMDRLGIGRAHYAGLSLGGMVGQWLAVHAPDRIDHLALLATTAHAGPAQNWHDRAALARREGPGALADTVVARWFTEDFAKTHPHEVTEIRDGIAATPAEGYAACCEAVARWDVREDLHRVGAPTLVIGGTEDRSTPVDAHGRLIAERVPRARLVVLEHAAHLLSWERAAPVNALLTRHLSADHAREEGERVREDVLGPHRRDPSSPFERPVHELATRFTWGEIWSRPGLDRRTRCCVALACLVAGRDWDAFPDHVRGALRSGLSAQEIGEVLLQTAPHSGLPAAQKAFALARRVLDEQP